MRRDGWASAGSIPPPQPGDLHAAPHSTGSARCQLRAHLCREPSLRAVARLDMDRSAHSQHPHVEQRQGADEYDWGARGCGRYVCERGRLWVRVVRCRGQETERQQPGLNPTRAGGSRLPCATVPAPANMYCPPCVCGGVFLCLPVSPCVSQCLAVSPRVSLCMCIA